MLFLTTSKRYYVVGVHTFPKGRAICLLCPLPRGFEWFLFVTKNSSWGGGGGGVPGEAIDKCNIQNKMITGTIQDSSLLQIPNCKTVNIYHDLNFYYKEKMKLPKLFLVTGEKRVFTRTLFP